MDLAASRQVKSGHAKDSKLRKLVKPVLSEAFPWCAMDHVVTFVRTTLLHAALAGLESSSGSRIMTPEFA